MPLYIGEKCSKCNIGVMTHPEIYVYTCSHCGYSYLIDPNARWGDSGVKILSQGSY